MPDGTAPLTEAPGRVLNGLMMVVAATFLFGASDVIGKHLAMLYALPVIIAARYLINLMLLSLFIGPRQGAVLWRTRRTGLVLLRGLCLAMASLTMMGALRLMPVGETVAIIYVAPFAVMLLAGRVLGETVTLAGWIGAIAGFLGVLMIVRPGSGLDALGVVLALVNAGLATGYILLTRILARTETAEAMLFHSALVGAGVFLILSLWSLDGAVPVGLDVGLTVLLGVLSTVAHVLFTLAYREASASVLAPVNYLHIVFAAILGAVVFGHVPDALALAGMALVIASGMAVALQARR